MHYTTNLEKYLMMVNLAYTVHQRDHCVSMTMKTTRTHICIM